MSNSSEKPISWNFAHKSVKIWEMGQSRENLAHKGFWGSSILREFGAQNVRQIPWQWTPFKKLCAPDSIYKAPNGHVDEIGAQKCEILRNGPILRESGTHNLLREVYCCHDLLYFHFSTFQLTTRVLVRSDY
jgi:hypothetical protein